MARRCAVQGKSIVRHALDLDALRQRVLHTMCGDRLDDEGNRYQRRVYICKWTKSIVVHHSDGERRVKVSIIHRLKGAEHNEIKLTSFLNDPTLTSQRHLKDLLL